jgi:hypothetical protein
LPQRVYPAWAKALLRAPRMGLEGHYAAGHRREGSEGLTRETLKVWQGFCGLKHRSDRVNLTLSATHPGHHADRNHPGNAGQARGPSGDRERTAE